ncbi:hypothetical protein ACIRD2_09615 [Streptomyces sp. NPDC093595]|uniref:hypothetical protein n=1 Tax=Streptomyces sp. NPDC093595 TaxID=3366045 RepID=UPI0038121C37
MGLVAVVVAIVGALLATGMGPTLAGELRVQVCRVTGGENCGGGDRGPSQAQGEPAGDEGDEGGDGGGQRPAADGEGEGKPPEQVAYEKALKDLQDAQAAEKADRDKAIAAARELGKILAEELGITDAFDCITRGTWGRAPRR